MSTTVLLIRHPESAWNRRGIYQGRRDISLSPLGRLQAELVAARLSLEHVSGIVCSPLQRARTLAETIGRYHHLEPQPDERLTEIGHGPWEGLTRDEVCEQFPELYAQWIESPESVKFPEGESLHEVHARCVPVLEGLLALPSGTWVVVTHDTVCRLAVAAAQRQPVTGFASVQLENAGITTLVGPTLIGGVRHVNDVAHLGEHRVRLETQAL
jgi:broad specificity phosphatase PhoE